jgi:septal ring factor EnvC (AmiA/AmiB activator)
MARGILPRPGLWVAALLLAAAPPAAHAQEQGLPVDAGIAQELEASRQRLEQIQRERAELRREMSGIESRVHDISAELELAEREIDNSNRMLAELEFQVERQQAQIDATTQDLTATRQRLTDQKRLLNLRLREIYKRGPLRTVQVLLGAESFSDLLNRYKYMSMIARYDRQLLGQVGALESRLIARERLLSRSLAELQEAQEARAAEHQALETLEARQRRALASAQQARRTTATRLARLEEDAKSLTTLITTLEERRREAARRASGAETAALTRSDVGTLAWPVDGSLLYPFGRQTQENGTTLRWNGIGIAAPEGSGVRAIESGTVVLAGPFEGYGPTVVVSHGGGYYSLYLYLKEVAVKQGDAVERGKLLGSVGGARTPEGPHIEFQIRSPGGEAVDPLPWLRRRTPA